MSFDSSVFDSEIFGAGEKVPISLGGGRPTVELDYETFIMLFGSITNFRRYLELIGKKGYDGFFNVERELTGFQPQQKETSLLLKGTLPPSFRETRKLQGKIVGFSKALKTLEKIEEQQLFPLKFETSIKVVGKTVEKGKLQ